MENLVNSTPTYFIPNSSRMSWEDESEEKENSNSAQWDETLVLALRVDDEEDDDAGQHGKREGERDVPVTLMRASFENPK